jgi:hypothetical protein
MFRHMKYTAQGVAFLSRASYVLAAVRQLAGMARQKAMCRDVLFHGTRYAELILKTGILIRTGFGDQKVSLTRPPR